MPYDPLDYILAIAIVVIGFFVFLYVDIQTKKLMLVEVNKLSKSLCTKDENFCIHNEVIIHDEQ